MFRSRQVSVDKADNEQRLTKLWDIYSKNYEQGVANMKAEELPSINQSTFYSLIRYTSRSQSQQSMGKTLRGRPWRPTHYQYWPPCGPLPGVTFIIVTRLSICFTDFCHWLASILKSGMEPTTLWVTATVLFQSSVFVLFF